MWFVVYTGDIVNDPMDCGCKDFVEYDRAMAFIGIMRNKGYHAVLYQGQRRNE